MAGMCVGKLNVRQQFFIEWSITNFFSLSTDVKKYYSPVFSAHGDDWRLKICPFGQKEKNSEGCIDLYLMRATSGPPVDLKFNFGLKTSENRIQILQRYQFTFKAKYHFHGSIKFLDRSRFCERKSEFAPSDTVTWVCQLERPEPTDSASDVPSKICSHCEETVSSKSILLHEKKCLNKPIKCPDCSDVIILKDWLDHECQTRAKGEDGMSSSSATSKILDDLKQLFLNQEKCDVVLRVKGHEFPAHKSILIARSPVFRSILQNNTQGKENDVVDIEGGDPSTFSDFLYFLYCGDADCLTKENAFNICSVADLYHVSDLRTKCLEVMKEKLSVDTFGESLDLHNSESEPIQLAAA